MRPLMRSRAKFSLLCIGIRSRFDSEADFNVDKQEVVFPGSRSWLDAFQHAFDTLRYSTTPRKFDYPLVDVTDEARQYVPAIELFDFQNPELQGTYLALYKAAPGRSRWSCRRRGTSIGFCMDDGMVPAERERPR